MSSNQNKLLRVIHFIPSLAAADGGTTTYMQQLAPVLGTLCQLHICALGDPNTFVPLPHCEVHALPYHFLQWRQMCRQWMQLLRDVRPDVIHINCCWMPQIALITLMARDYIDQQKDRRVQLFLTPHGMLEPWILKRNYWTRKWPAIQMYQYRSVAVCDRVIATAEMEREHILQLGWNDRVSVVENGIDVTAIEVKKSWQLPRRLLFMSRLHPKKGLELVLQALVEHPEFSLTVAGRGDVSYRAYLEKLTVELQLEDRVSFVGDVYDEEKWALLRSSDAVVLPSYSENYGLIIAEALASGVPVITTTETPWQSVQRAQCGWWVQPDVPSIGKALTALARCSVEQMQQMGIRARQLAERDCAISVKVGQLFKLYLSNNP